MVTAPPSALNAPVSSPAPESSGSDAPAGAPWRQRVLGCRGQVVACCALAVALRGWFFSTPLSPDEGGYLAIARAWRHGARLYGDVWIDRPQGLLVVYRMLDMLGGGSNSVRVLSLLAAVMSVAGVAMLVRSISTPTAGAVAALFTAVLSTAPVLEGFAANGELLGGAFAAMAMGVGAHALVGRGNAWWMVAAGALAACAVSMKQSAIDAIAAWALWLLIAFVVGAMRRRALLAHAARFALGAVLVVGPLLVHGALTGWSRWWYAVMEYRLSRRSVLEEPNWDQLFTTGHHAAPVLLPLIALTVVVGVMRLVAHRHGRPPAGMVWLLTPLWLLTSVAGFLSGGQFFHHYWITLTFPIAALGGLVIGSLGTRWRTLIAAAAVALALSSWMDFATASRSEFWLTLKNESRPLQAREIGDWLRPRMQPGDSLYSMCAAASLYAVTGADPPYPYLWWDGVHQARDAQPLLVELFTGPTPPTWVVAFNSSISCDPSGEVRRVMLADYRLVDTVAGRSIFHHVADTSG